MCLIPASFNKGIAVRGKMETVEGRGGCRCHPPRRPSGSQTPASLVLIFMFSLSTSHGRAPCRALSSQKGRLLLSWNLAFNGTFNPPQPQIFTTGKTSLCDWLVRPCGHRAALQRLMRETVLTRDVALLRTWKSPAALHRPRPRRVLSSLFALDTFHAG